VSPDRFTLIKGAGVAIGECIFGVNGPFLFSQFGVPVGAAALCGVMLGGVVGYGAALALWHASHRERVPRHTGPRITVDSAMPANLRM